MAQYPGMFMTIRRNLGKMALASITQPLPSSQNTRVFPSMFSGCPCLRAGCAAPAALYSRFLKLDLTAAPAELGRLRSRGLGGDRFSIDYEAPGDRLGPVPDREPHPKDSPGRAPAGRRSPLPASDVRTEFPNDPVAQPVPELVRRGPTCPARPILR